MSGRTLSRRYAVCLFLVAVAVGAQPVLAKVVYVSKTGNDANDGLTWATAKLTVQAGLNAAASGDQVWVAAGTYVERVTLRSGAALYGGFAGSETELSQRNWVTNKTTLDGNRQGTVVTSQYDTSSATRIDGFTITKGRVTSGFRYGGGISCKSSSPTIANNTITGNTASATGSGGGGIGCDFSSPTIANNTITANIAPSGGGIYCNGFSTIVGNKIAANAAAGASSSSGGGIYCAGGVVANNIITGNSASYGGGIYGGSATIANNYITGNGAGSGGAIHCISTPIVNNTILGNSNSTYDSGAINCMNSLPVIANTIIAFNSAGIYNRPGSDTLTLRHNCVYGNTAYNYSYNAGRPDPTGTNGNISSDPRVAGWKYGRWHIQADSPCVGAGDNASLPPDTVDLDGDGDTSELLPIDLDGQTRIQGQDGTVDIGADESDGTDWPEGPGVIVRVSLAGDDANDGSSWSLAKRTVQSGINAASAMGGEVWVQSGTYLERIALGSFAHVYGGFDGTELVRESRDWASHATILDGQQGGSVVTALEDGGVSTIDGFTIRNGTGTGSGSSRYGGGIYCVASSPTIRNNTVTGNTASGGGGGGIYCGAGCPIIANNTIAANDVPNTTGLYGGGGGICCFSSPVILNNTIIGNSTSGGGGKGGGIFCDNGLATIANNAITGNIGTYGGGICSGSQSAPTIVGNTITMNNATSGGGGLSLLPPYWTGTISNTIIAFNSSGIMANNTPLVMNRNCVYGNAAYDYYSGIIVVGLGSIAANPMFVRSASPGPDGQWGTPDDDYGDLRLRAGSPCIDAGDNSMVPADTLDLDGDGDATEPIPFDLAGMARFFDHPLAIDTGLGTPPIVDIGAYEDFADCNGNGVPDQDDPDADGDGIIDACDNCPAGANSTQTDSDSNGIGDVCDSPLLLSAASRKTHGAAGEFDIALPLNPVSSAGIECRKDGPTKVVLTFSKDVMAADGTPDATEVTLSAGVLGPVTISGSQMTVNLSGVPDMTCLAITLSGIVDLAGNPLTGDNDVHIRVLLGDTNGTGSVSVADVDQTRSRSGQNVTSTRFRSDTNCSGSISVADVNQVRSRSGNSVTCP